MTSPTSTPSSDRAVSCATEDASASPSRARRLRHDLWLITSAWFFGAVWMWIINGTTLPQFARALHTPDWAFGLIAMMPYIGVLFQLPAGWVLDRYGYRKSIFFYGALIHRLALIPIALIPWVLPDVGPLWWITLLVFLFMNWSIGNLSGPAWMSWMADVIPRKVRGRYFAFRTRIGQGIGIATLVLVGYILDRAMQADETSPGLAMKVMSLILGVAGIVGVGDILCFLPIKDDYPTRTEPDKSLLAMVMSPLRDRDFRYFLGYMFTLNLAIGFIGQYVMLYAVKELGMSNLQAQLLIFGVPLVAQMSTAVIWGRLIDRLGRKPVLVVGMSCIVLGSVGWLFIGKDAAHPIDWNASWLDILWQLAGGEWSWKSRLGYLSILLTTAVWPGVDLANFNVIMDLAGAKKKQGGAAYVAVNSLAIALGGVLSGIMASLLTKRIEGIQIPVAFLGIVITYHGILFIISALLRILSVVFVLRIHEPKAVGTRAALEYMGESFYAQVREIVVVPTKMVDHVARWTYLVTLPVGKRIRFGGLQTKRWWRRKNG